ncbi:hypothetical protein [Photobacterium sanctipauli]|uniref:hypothetical protein n=1 Tax=Photobacterium sanctipauli TaxID=1342794 RepID=UPI001B86AB1C|nr:hypothetical protein [Photobacterium sanctipauli]
MTVTYNHLDQAVGYPMPEWHGAQPPAALTIDGQYCRLEPLSCRQHGDDLFEAFQLDTDNRTWTYLFMGPFDNQADFNQ